MPKRTRRTNLSSLIDKYQNLSVVSQIEQNLLSGTRNYISKNELILNDLYLEENYDLSHYFQLEESLKKDGFLVPLIVVKQGKQYAVINGVKRFLIAKKIGIEKMPCVLGEIQQDRLHSYVIEHIMDENEHVLIKAYAFDVLNKKYHYSDDKIAELAHISLTQVRNIKRLTKLPSFLKEALLSFKISYSEARSLLNLPIEKQKELYHEILSGNLSVRDLEKEKRTFIGTQHKRKIRLQKKKVIIQFKDEEEAKKYYPQIVKEFSD